MMKTEYLETKFAGTVGSALKLEYNSLFYIMAFMDSLLTLS